MAERIIRNLEGRFEETKFKIRCLWLRKRWGRGTVGVTYANNMASDGAGAQLQRIYGVFAISRLLKLPYIHSPISRIVYQGLAALEKNWSDGHIESRYNSRFSIASDIRLPYQYEVVNLEDVSVETLARLKRNSARSGTFSLARIKLPYGITDILPDAYEAVKKVSPYKFQWSLPLRIAIHVRRGDLQFREPFRMLPNRYYISVARRVGEILDRLNLSHTFELHTETARQKFTVTKNHRGVAGEIPHEVTVDPGKDRLDDFDSIPNLRLCINGDPIWAIERMATAHVLIGSHSSFSYVASILNPKGVIIYHPFWHKPMSPWLVTGDSGHFCERGFVRSLPVRLLAAGR